MSYDQEEKLERANWHCGVSAQLRNVIGGVTR